MKQQELKEKWEHGIKYVNFKDLMDELVKQGRTTGPNQSKAMVHYTKLNDQRMRRLDKAIRLRSDLISELKNLSGNYGWLVLTEAWCGDVANNVSVLNKMVEQTSNISMRFLLRDEHPDLMDEFLTDGGRGIPKLIVLNLDTYEVVGTWGPRPAPAQQIMRAYKKKEDMTYDEVAEKIQRWYIKDRNETIQYEFRHLLPVWEERIFAPAMAQ